MKKIILLILVSLMSSLGYAQLNENFDAAPPTPDVSGVWALSDGNWLVTDNLATSTIDWQTTSGPPFPPYLGTGQSAFVSRENVGQGNTSEEWLITPLVNVTANRQLRFYTRQTLIGDTGTLYQVRVSNNPDQSNLGAFTTLVSYTETQLSQLTTDQLDFEEKFINLAFTGNRYFAFVKVHTQLTPATSGDRWLIDNVRIVERCQDPTTLGATAMGTTTGTVTWVSSATSYSIEYGINGFTPGEGTVVNNIPDGGATDSYTFPVGTLTQDQCYQFYVTAFCGTGDNVTSSTQVGPYLFCTTPLGATCAEPIVVTPLPYFTSDNTVNFGNNITATGPGTTCGATGNFLGGDDVVYTYTNPSATPATINIQMNPLGATNTGVFVYGSCANIGVSCLAGVGNANANIREIATFNLAANQTIYIVVSSTTATSDFPYTLAIQTVNCPAPVNGTPTAIGMTDATLNWTNGTGSTSTGWEVVVQTGAGMPTIPPGAGFPVTGVNPPTVSAAAAFGAPLTAATTYYYWLRADCGNGTYSLWSGPFTFNTRICEAVDQCNYTFITQDSFGDGWNGAIMQVRQNGIVVATLTGPTDPDNQNPITYTVPMCHNMPFDLNWLEGGGFPGEVRVSIRNSFNQTIYAMTTASGGLAGTVLHAGTVDCVNPRCLVPTAVAVPAASITTNGATINWTSSGVPTTGWELYIVPQTSPDPLPNSAATHTASGPTATYAVSGLNADTCYKVFVRSVCSVNSPSDWTAVAVTFCTLPTCPKPTGITVPTATITLHEATINWNAVGAATGYQVAIVPSGTTLPLPESVWTPVQTATTYTTPLDSLDSATLYDVYVRSICLGGTDIGQPSAVVTFNTIVCLPEQQCNYTFTLTDSFGDGWNNARMQVRQNGIVVATLGATFTGGAGPVVVTVPLCHGIPFDLYWSVAGGFPGECRIKITNNFGQELYAMTAASAGLVGTVLYAQEEVDCLAPLCLPPTLLSANPSIFDAIISWTASTFNTAYDVYIVTAGTNAPDEDTTPTYSNVTGTSINTLTATPEFHLDPSTEYTVYVRAICDANSPSDWTPGVDFTTLPTCPQPINLIVEGTDTNSAQLSWTEVGPATQWEVFVVPADSPVPTPGSGVIVTGTPSYNTLTGPGGQELDPGLYDYYVISQCTDSDHSVISGPTSFFILNTQSVCPEVILEVATTSPGIIDLCPGACVDLSASFVDFKDTSTYVVDAVPFAPPFPFIGGTELNIATDDIWGPPVTLPFDFCFFGVNSQQVQVGSNGVVTFTPQAFPGTCPWAFTQTIPNTGFPIRNAIYGVYQDINPNVSTAPLVHSINYQILGEAPCRAFVVNYYQVAQFSCGTSVGLQTSQIVLYETSNIVEVYVQDRTVCSGWNSGSGVIGIQNAAGTQAHFPPGRNTGPWEAQSEAYRFTPNGDSNVEFTWLQGTDPVGDGATDINVCPTETTMMTARAVYTGCGGDQVTKEVNVLLRINEVDIQPIADVSQCECYTLPVLPEGQHYFAQAGGTGEEIPAGTVICDNQTIYVFASSNTTPPCTDEEEFTVTVNQIQAPVLQDVTVCESYTLPDLAEPFLYYSEPSGGGTNYPNGTVITEPSTIHIIGVNGECISESSFVITIGDIVAQELNDVTDCNSYELPTLPPNQTYHPEPAGAGTEILPGTVISTPGTTTIYIYAQQGTCVDESEFTITIDDEIVPEFEQIQSICLNAAPPALPTSSNNTPAITGIWNPATIDTTVAGTFTFTFTPDGTIPCAVQTTMDITITEPTAPVFNPAPALCLNAVYTLPSASDDQIPVTGTWSPSANVDTTVAGTFTYTFTPDAGQGCLIPATMDITINSEITPLFTQIANICQGIAVVPELPTVSNNIINGTWSPATIDVTTPNTTVYTFTPDLTTSPCAISTTMTVTVDPEIVPTFNAVADVCQNSLVIPVLPSVSLNGITGTWSPATIDISGPNTTTYCFTPDAGQGCAVEFCMNINVVAPKVPDFQSSYTVCFNGTAPVLAGTSPNGVNGSWSPAIVDNTASGIYTFTPNAGECAVPQVINVTVLPEVTPTFVQLGPICANDAAPVLPLTSTNVPGITGTWSPAVVDNTTTGVYTFTPAAGQCAVSVTMTITVNPSVTASFTQIGPLCQGTGEQLLPTEDLNGVQGSWNPSQISTDQSGTFAYVFTPSGVTCGQAYTMDIVIAPQADVDKAQGCEDNNYVLRVTGGASGAVYSWTNSDGSPLAGAGNNSSAVVTTAGTYHLEITVGGCASNYEFIVPGISCGLQKGISPGDGDKNDFFDLAGQNVRKLEIFNRYGTKVYSQVNYSREWYGQSDKGDELPDGTYYYVIEKDTATTTGWIYINRVK